MKKKKRQIKNQNNQPTRLLDRHHNINREITDNSDDSTSHEETNRKKTLLLKTKTETSI